MKRIAESDVLPVEIDVIRKLTKLTVLELFSERDEKNSFETSMHSSRMRTACLLHVSPSMHCSRGGGLILGGVCFPEGCASWGCLLPGGVCFPGVFASMGGSAQTPPMDKILDTRF